MTFDNFADKLMHLLSANVHVNQAKWSKSKFSRAALCRNLILPMTKTIKRRLGCLINLLIFFFTFLTTLMGTAFFLFVCLFCLWAKSSVTVVYLIITLLLVLKLILIGTTMK